MVQQLLTHTLHSQPPKRFSVRLKLIFLSLFGIALLCGSTAQAQSTMWWDANNGSGLQAGDGHWRTSGGGPNGTRWATSATPGTAAPALWVNGRHAIYLTSGSSDVDVNGTVTVASILFSGTGYTITGGTFSLVGTGGNITTNQNATIEAPIGGNVGLTKLGTGSLILSGSNVHTGLTAISAGILNAQNANAFGATGAGNGTSVASNAALELQNNIAVGNEALTLNGSGVGGNGALRSVSGTNSWAGAIALGSASTITSASNSLTLTGGINNGGNLLSFDGAGDATVSTNGISGAGGLTKGGNGKLTFTSTNSYGGTTTISGGTLQVGNGGTSGTLGSAAVVNNGALIFDRLDTASVANSISGGGSVTQEGSGELVLSGTSTYNGNTAVNDGTLRISGVLGATAVNVSNASTLSGNGSIGGPVNVTANAFIAPGNSPGTLNLGDDLTLDGTYLWELAALLDNASGTAGSDWDLLDMSGGTAFLTSGQMTLDFLGIDDPDSGNPFWNQNHTWTVLSGADNIVGLLTVTNALYTAGIFTLTNNSNDVFLNYVTAIPEPTTIWGAILLIGSFILRRHRR